MSLPSPFKVKETVTKRLKNERLTHEEINQFMMLNGISDAEMAAIFGVTLQCVRLWVRGQREFSVTNSRLIRLFQKYPNLIREF